MVLRKPLKIQRVRWGALKPALPPLKVSSNTRVHFGVFQVPTVNILGSVEMVLVYSLNSNFKKIMTNSLRVYKNANQSELDMTSFCLSRKID